MQFYMPLYQTLMAVAAQCGMPVNYQKLANDLCITAAAAKLRIRKLTGMDMIALLPAYQRGDNSNRAKGDAVCLKHVDGLICRYPQLKAKLPKPCALSIPRIIERESRRFPGSRFSHHRSYSGSGVDLIVQRGEYHFGITILPLTSFTRRNVGILRSAVVQGFLQRGFVLYPSYRAFFIGRNILAVPTPVFLATYDYWTNAESDNADFRLLSRWVNQF
jgi:hypothetical protein